ncbi:trichohyalin-like isoform X2 [Hydractinia symbiolongicarpus]|uniref:trichohyalin-like isoform X2 n=1 Tax=Hydractinia symbiolongicarpus TaxID=13093 RepID=UPI00254E3A50|nr:trichohyalin-like isoform X2 [Hydractinia symbiolongicarpus]
MSGIKKLFGGKKKSGNDRGAKGSRESFRSSTGSLPGLSKSSSSLNLAASVESLNGYNLKEKDLSKYLKASWTGDLAKLKQIASKKVNWNECDKEKRSALHLACAKGFEEVVDFLASHGVNVNAKDSEGKTPLSKACESNSTKCVEILLRNGAESNVFDVNHVSPIHVAAALGNVDIGIQLADHDAKLDTKDQNQITPLHLCCGLGNKDFVDFLISEYVGLDCLDSQKRTPLMMACIDGHMDIVEALLDGKADTSLLDKNGNTAEELASINNNVSISRFISEKSKPKSDPLSPIGSIHSPKSPAELFSPVAKSLNDMFSPSGSQTSQSNVFGGPAIDMGGPTFDKSEESRSEPLGDNSWGDSDSDSLTEKKPKGPSLSALMKQKETEAKKSPIKTAENVKASKSKELVDQPKPSTENKTQQKSPKVTQNLNSPTGSENSSPIANMKIQQQSTSKLPWQDNDFSDESESEWGDEGLEKQFAAGVMGKPQHEQLSKTTPASTAKSKENIKKDKETLPHVVPPPPPPDIDFSQASSDFDSSQPEETFSDLPLSGVNGANKIDEKLKKKAKDLFLSKQPKDDENAPDEEDTNWDSTDDEFSEGNNSPNVEKNLKSTQPDTKTSAQKNPASEAKKSLPNKPLSMTPDNDSDWDSESALPSEASEEVIPPQTPEPESEFEPSSSEEAEESDIDLEKLNSKKVENAPSPIGRQVGIFQTEVLTPRGNAENQDVVSDDSEDEIEKQMMGLVSSQKKNVENEQNEIAPRTSTKNVKEQLGLDLGSSVSSVSDPEGLDSNAPAKLDDINNNNLATKQLTEGASKISTGISDDVSTETESEWEVEKRKQREANNGMSDPYEVKKEITDELQDEMLEDDKLEKEKDQQRIDDYEAKRKAHEDRLAAEIAEELRKEMLDENDNVDDLEFDSSSDFSFSQGGGELMDLPDNQNEASLSNDDDGEAELLKQMESKENEYHQEKEKKENQMKRKEKDEGIKTKLQDILERAKSPQSPNKVSELLNEKEADLFKRHEDADNREKEVAKREEENAARVRELENKNKEFQRLEEERMKQIREEEERLNRLKLEQELLKEKEQQLREAEIKKEQLAKETEERQRALQLEEEQRLRKLEEEERLHKERLAKEEEERLKVILQKEKQAREEHERNERLRKEELEKKEEEKRITFEKEKEERLLALEKEEEARKTKLRKIEEEKKLQLQQEEEDRRLALQKEEQEKMSALEKEELLRRENLLKEEEDRRKALQEEEHKRLRALSNEERERRKKIEDKETELSQELLRKKEELKRLQEQETKRIEILAQREAELKSIEQATENKRKMLEEQLLKDQELSRLKLEMEEQKRLEEIEILAKEKEREVEGRLSRMEQERKKKLEEEESRITERLQEQSSLNASLNDIKVERDRWYEELQAEKLKMKNELENELMEEGRKRKRKLSDEERKFREELEKERQEKLIELSNKSAEEQQNLQVEFEKAQKEKEEKFEREFKEREKELLKKLEEDECSRLKLFEDQVRLKEHENEERLKKFEENKRKELEEQRREFLKKIEEETAKNQKNYKEMEKKNRDTYQKKFHELERESRLKEQQLELQIAELRQKQRELSTKEKNTKKKVLTAIPAEEVIVAAVQVEIEQATPGMDMFDDREQENEEDNLRNGNNESKNDLAERLLHSQQQREIAKKKIANIEGRNKKSVDDGNNYANTPISPIKQSPLRYMKGTSTPLGGSQMLDGTFIDNLEEQLFDARRQIDMYRQKTIVQERLKKEMEYDLEEMHRTIDILNQSNNEKDRSHVDVDLELRSVKYKLEQESESKNMAERLCKQLKDQLARSEKKLTRETESRQNFELSNRKLEAELKAREQHILKLQSDLNEVQLVLDTEKQSRCLQQKLYEEQLHQHELILQEAQRTSHDHAKAVSKLEALDETCRNTQTTSDAMKIELAKAKGELSRVLSQLSDHRSQSDEEIKKLRNKLEEKTEALTAAEKNLFQLQLQLQNEKSHKHANEERMTSTLESETNLKKRLEEEIASLKSQLSNSNREIDRIVESKATTDKDMLLLKEKHASEVHQLQKDLNDAKEQLKTSEEKLSSTEAQVSMLTAQLQSTGLALAERKGEVVTAQNNVKETNSYVQQLEENFRNEKLLSHKLETKLEGTNERVTMLQRELDKVEKELTFTKEQFALKDKSASEKQEAVNAYILNVKEDFNKNLVITRDDLNDANTEKNVLTKEREKVLSENMDLRKAVSGLHNEVKILEENKFEIEQHVHEMNSELEKSRHLTDETTKRLVYKSGEVENMRKATFDLQDNLKDLKNQNITAEADLREEKAKAEMLIQELRSANEARENLEALLSDVKGNNIALEEKLHSEALHRSHRQREAEEHKGLWESEVKSRSKLGLKVIEMEKLINNLRSDIEEEKRKTRRALDLKKGSDSKIELYEQRSLQHHKEVSALRNKLKQYQRKVKGYETGESRIPALHAEFDREREAINSNVTKLRRQLDQLSDRLSHEQEMRTNSEKLCRQQMKELTDYKTQDKVHAYEVEKLEKKCRELGNELEEQKKYFNKNYIPQEEIEEFKRALETKARLDLNKKLQEVNMHLEEQSLAREAFEKIRNEKESRARKSFEETVSDLKNELSMVRSTLHEGLAKRDTSEVEAKRYRELFEQERTAKDYLSEKLNLTNDRLSHERSRTNYLFDETINKSKVSKKLFDDELGDDRNRSLLSPRATSLLSDLHHQKLWSTPAALSPHKTAERDYLSLKRRNVLS